MGTTSGVISSPLLTKPYPPLPRSSLVRMFKVPSASPSMSRNLCTTEKTNYINDSPEQPAHSVQRGLGVVGTHQEGVGGRGLGGLTRSDAIAFRSSSPWTGHLSFSSLTAGMMHSSASNR